MGYLACNNEGSPNKVIVGRDGVNDASAEEEQINNIYEQPLITTIKSSEGDNEAVDPKVLVHGWLERMVRPLP